jgi:glutamate synthase domain-containing protein 1
MIKKCLYKFYRYLAHNGEINTLRGNRNLMKAREGVMHSDKFGVINNCRNAYLR